MQRPKAASLIAIALLFGLAACNTMKGAGQDIKAGGQAIEKSATENGAQPESNK